MNILERWLPFKFRRRSAEDKKSEAKPARSADQSLSLREDRGPLMPMQHWMRDFFEHPFGQAHRWLAGEGEPWFGDFSPTRFWPHLDVSDEDGALKVAIELPGMSKDDVELSVENGMLTIRGEKRHEDQTTERGVYRTERYYGYVHRSLPLPEDVDQEHAEATFEKGVLTVRFPKLDQKQRDTRRIAIS